MTRAKQDLKTRN